MTHNRTLLVIGLCEVLIGVTTLVGLVVSVALLANEKTPNVFIFVLTTACISSLLGMGILLHSPWARRLLIYFSSVVILSKLLIFTDIIALNGAVETTIAPALKNILSVAYHGFVIAYLHRREVRQLFRQEAFS